MVLSGAPLWLQQSCLSLHSLSSRCEIMFCPHTFLYGYLSLFFFFLSLDLSSFLLSVRLPPMPFLTHLTHLCFCPNTQPSSPLSLPGCCPSTSFPTYSSSSPSLRHLIHYPTISTIHRFHSISCSVFPAEFQWKHKYSYSVLNASGLSKEKKKELELFSCSVILA